VYLHLFGGTDDVTVHGDHDWTVTNSAITGGGLDVEFSEGEAEYLTVYGGDSANTIDATAFDSLHFQADGGGGDDIIKGVIHGQNTLTGGDGNDRLEGGVSSDSLAGENDNDTLIGGQGKDYLSGGLGNDLLYGDQDNGEGAGDGDDLLNGDEGADELHGSGGNDTLNGAAGADSLYGDSGDDSLSGGDDADQLDAGAGTDTCDGGKGFDSVGAEDSLATIYEYDDESDRLSLSDASNTLFYSSPGGSLFEVTADGIHSSSIATGVAAQDLILRGSFGQMFLHGNDRVNTFDIADACPYITIDPGSGTDKPLRSIESDFAVDSSGLSTSRWVRWYDHKYGVERQGHDWVKVHIASGVKTNVVTAAAIYGRDTNDCPILPELVRETANTFTLKEVSADKGYLSVENVEAIHKVGAEPFIAPKANTTGAAGGLFQKMIHFYLFNQEEYVSRYHKRSNVESTFSMVKQKFGDSLRSRSDVAMRNETYCKLICHNLCCVIQSQCELGIEPIFWKDPNRTPGERKFLTYDEMASAV
jgi:transposase